MRLKLPAIFPLTLIPALLYSQSSDLPRDITKEDSLSIQQEVKKQAKALLTKLKGDEDKSYERERLTIEFTIDTFEIAKELSLNMAIDYSTWGMITATNNAEIKYDLLLNKYYNRLLRKLEKPDQELLRQSQRNWIAFRDSELKINSALTKDVYTGGGTIQGIIVAYKALDLTKNRVVEIYHYLNRISLNQDK